MATIGTPNPEIIKHYLKGLLAAAQATGKRPAPKKEIEVRKESSNEEK